jgi:hypothetical protein
VSDDDEPEEIEFDFDKYKNMYKENAQLIESDLNDDDEDYELGANISGIRGLANGANFKTTFVKVDKEDFTKAFSLGKPNPKPDDFNNGLNFISSPIFNNLQGDGGFIQGNIATNDTNIYIYKGLKGVDCFKYVYDKNLL